MTIVLVGSSGVLHWAGHEARAGRPRRLDGGLALTAVLGFAFLLLQWGEYREKLGRFTPQANAYASAFFAITGFHGLHVAFGVLLLLYTLARSRGGHFANAESVGVSVVSLYWHFVDAVWLVLFTTLYLLPWVQR
jgi:heme/copper-type cytochrome/quinol oxidase subunit 3